MVQGLFDEEDSEIKEAGSSNRPVESIFSSAEKDEVVTRPAYTPDTVEETARKSGLAFSAGIAFFGSIVFMLLLGWFLLNMKKS